MNARRAVAIGIAQVPCLGFGTEQFERIRAGCLGSQASLCNVDAGEEEAHVVGQLWLFLSVCGGCRRDQLRGCAANHGGRLLPVEGRFGNAPKDEADEAG